ncbi:MAG TPA: hypothetical protein VGO67_16840 [Verrucomicrobiae bacterium]|jgi:hypothetical protein
MSRKTLEFDLLLRSVALPIEPCLWYCLTISANEVFEQVKALPARERRKFFESVHELETANDVRPPAGRKIRTRWPNAAARRRKITGGKIVPNLVLLSREHEEHLI